MTWRTRKIIVRNEQGDEIKVIPLPKEIEEGWGITHDYWLENNIYYISDGSNVIFECDAD